MNNENNNIPVQKIVTVDAVAPKAETKAKTTKATKAKTKKETAPKAKRTKLTPAQKAKAKREANIKCCLANPEKYGRKTVSTTNLLSVIRGQVAEAEAQKKSASKYATAQLNASISTLQNLEKSVLDMMVEHYKG